QFYLKIGVLKTTSNIESSLFQTLHRTCWTSNVAIGAITDFQSLHVYDLHSKPGSKPKIIFSCEYKEYSNKWEKIYNLLSKETVKQGSLKKYRRETLNSVPYYFANELLGWHLSLVKNISSKYSELSNFDIEITSARIINRIILLRFCENLGIEPLHQLKSLVDSNHVYKSLLNIFDKANEKYNSGLFYFHRESGRNAGSLDLISFKIDIDDDILKNILNKLYSDDHPINYSIIFVSTVATAFNIYINHIINNSFGETVSSDYLKNNSIIENNALVDLIIKKTHGNFLEGKKPGKRSSVSTIKILDICCGSGLFLLKSFEYMLNWHLNEYVNLYSHDDSPKDSLPIKFIEDGHWQLSWEEKKRILKNNIFGVDINRLAIESAELILLLKLLEDISPESIQDQLKLFWQHALPDLNENLKCGNAIIESDIYKLQQFVATNENEKTTINAFDWQKEFHNFHPIENFDIIVGNPPSNFSEFLIQKTKPYFKQRYDLFKDFRHSYLLFYEKSLKLLKKNGLLGFIVPEDWLSNSESFSIPKNYWIKDVYKLKSGTKIIGSAESLITIIKKQFPGETNVHLIKNLNFEKPLKAHHFKFINYLNINYFFGYFDKYLDSDLNKKITINSKPLSNFARSFSGYNAYEKGKGLSPNGGVQTKETIKLKPYHSDKKLNEQWKTEIVGRDITRYCLKFTGMRWIKYGPWLAAQRDPDTFIGERILLHERISINDGRIESTICSNEVFHGRDIIAIKLKIDFPNIYYLLGILNSKLFNWHYLVNYSTKFDEA
ncbi:MAG: Eco57I restriction-modification methylase domain-containing protein, partial [Calditrichia bacterium]|nr:Eco57I restriction-modification methylase domain-containing protein [Calditrichia bacterium]